MRASLAIRRPRQLFRPEPSPWAPQKESRSGSEVGAGKTFIPAQASPTVASRSAPPHTNTNQAIRLRNTHSAPISRANRSWRLCAFSVPWRAARSDGVARSRACTTRAKRPAETPPLPIVSRASNSMVRVQSRMSSPMKPRPRNFAAPRARSATRIAAMNGKIRRKNSSQDGRTIMIATSSGDNRSMKPGKDRLIAAATFRLPGRCAPHSHRPMRCLRRTVCYFSRCRRATCRGSRRRPEVRPVTRCTYAAGVRKTWMSRSRIFLRRVLRLRPSSAAARIWLPRVAASAAIRSGRSTCCRMRS